MSTRSTVKIIGEFASIKLYHHHDGYPEGVGFDLMNRFWKEREDDRKWEYNAIANALVKDANDEYEITEYNHTDREYEYEIDIVKKTIRCWECNWDTSGDDWKCEKGEEVDLKSMWEKETKKSKIQEVLEKQGFNVKRENTDWYISQYTPSGEDWGFYLENLEDIEKHSEKYDPEEDFNTLWQAKQNGLKGVPSVAELWKDQLWKQETLKRVVEELK